MQGWKFNFGLKQELYRKVCGKKKKSGANF